MALDNPKKRVSTIFLGNLNETTVEGLDAMQASIKRENWNKSTQELYLDKIREKATEKAKQILGTAYTERQKVIDSAYVDAQKIREEANQFLAQAKEHEEQSRLLHEEAQLKFDTSEETGFESGLTQASDEITDFRIAMGSAIISVMNAIEKQSELIFEQWRDDIVELVHICVEKSSAWIINAEHKDIIKTLVMSTIKQLLDKRQINIYVHPDDEETVSQLFNFAKEAMPDIKHWDVNSDPNLQLGDLIAECSINALHNKHDDRVAMVENILQKLNLPKSSMDKPDLDNVQQSVEDQIQKVNDLVPELETIADDAQQENPETENNNTDNPDPGSPDSENLALDSAETDNQNDYIQNKDSQAPNSQTPDSQSNDAQSMEQENLAQQDANDNPQNIADNNQQDLDNANADEANADEANANETPVPNEVPVPNEANNLNPQDAANPQDTAANPQDTANPQDAANPQNSDPNPQDTPANDVATNEANTDEASAPNEANNLNPQDTPTNEVNADETPAPTEQELAAAKEQEALDEQKRAAKKELEDLEQELLPLPEYEDTDFGNSDNASELDSVYATGGFLTAPDKANT